MGRRVMENLEKLYQYRCLLCNEEFQSDNAEIIIEAIQEHSHLLHRLPGGKYDCQLECLHCDFVMKTTQIYDIDDYITHNCRKMESIRAIRDEIQDEYDFKDEHVPKYHMEG